MTYSQVLSGLCDVGNQNQCGILVGSLEINQLPIWVVSESKPPGVTRKRGRNLLACLWQGDLAGGRKAIKA